MKNPKFLITITTSLLLLVVYSCTEGFKNSNPYYSHDIVNDYSYYLEKGENLGWHLDSLTDNIFSSSFYNILDSSFYYLNDSYLIKCDFNEPEAERSPSYLPLSNFCIVNDTIWGINYNNSELQKYVKDELIESIKITGIEIPPLPRVGISPIIINDSLISYFGSVAGEMPSEDSLNRPTFTQYNRNYKNFNFLLGYPDIYHKANWGGGMLRWVYATFNNKKNLFIVSFPASHNIEIWDPELNLSYTKYAGSCYIADIEPYSNKVEEQPSTEKILDYISKTNCYGNIFYDEWNNLYYRIAEIAPNNYKNKKTVSIIIIDENFDKVGESIIDNISKDFRYAMFVSYKGLMVPVNDSEDYLKYVIYHPGKKEKNEKIK